MMMHYSKGCIVSSSAMVSRRLPYIAYASDRPADAIPAVGNDGFLRPALDRDQDLAADVADRRKKPLPM